MKIININKEQFLSFLLNTDYFSQGQFGIITLFNNKFYKIYYKDFINTYLTRDENVIDNEVNSWLEVENNINMGLRNPNKRLQEFEQLLNTKSYNLITGILSYKGLLVGIEMNYYEDYISLVEASKIVTKGQLKEYLTICYDLILDLMENNIVSRER